MTPTPPEYRRRRLVLALLALSVATVAQLHDRPVLGTVSLSLDADHAPEVRAVLAPALEAVATVLADTAQRLIR